MYFSPLDALFLKLQFATVKTSKKLFYHLHLTNCHQKQEFFHSTQLDMCMKEQRQCFLDLVKIFGVHETRPKGLRSKIASSQLSIQKEKKSQLDYEHNYF